MRPESTQPPGVFISYRRSDSSFPASWLYDVLVRRFGPSHIFKDVDSIRPGDDFVEVIGSSVVACHTMLVVIGSHWLGVDRRIDAGADFVQLEVQIALANGLRVIPLLIDGARMPAADELPTSITALAHRNAIALSPHHFEADVQRLIPTIERAQQDAERRASDAGPRPAAPTRAAPPVASDDTDQGTPQPARPGGSGILGVANLGLGIVALVLGVVLKISILWTLGVILLVVGAVLAVIGLTSRSSH